MVTIIQIVIDDELYYAIIDSNADITLTTDVVKSTVFRTDIDVDDGDKVSYFLNKIRQTHPEGFAKTLAVSRFIFKDIDSQRIEYQLTSADYRSLY